MSKTIKSERSQTVVHTPWEEGMHTGNASETHHTVSDSGGLESQTLQHEKPHYCGCIGQAGGCCSGCSHVICTRCYTRCLSCDAALGPCCSQTVSDAGGQLQHYCRSCHGTVRRQRLFRTLLSPFIRFEN